MIRQPTSPSSSRPRAAPALKRASALVHEQARGRLAALPALDRHLPGGGLEPGTLVEVLAERGQGGLRLALRLAAGLQDAARRRALVVVDVRDEQGEVVYGPALAQVGLDLGRLVVLRPRAADLLACLDEVLRSTAVGVVVAATRAPLPSTASHRLRLAAREGGGVGLLLRPPAARTEVSGAALRLLVREGGAPGRPLLVEPVRARGVPDGAWSVPA